MCGLCGFVTKKGVKLTPEQIFKRGRAMEALLIANESRGTNSTGIALVDKDAVIIKRAQTASEFVRETIIQKAFLTPARIMMGHTRAATMGAINDKNAHPFQEGSIIGAHNGVISNHMDLHKDIEVDSQAVIKQLNLEKNDYQKTFSMVQGSCALTWIDMNDPNVLYLVAHLNPLAVAKVPEIETIFWSSELNHLKISLTALFGSISPLAFSVKQDKVYKINSTLQIKGDRVGFKSYNYLNPYLTDPYYRKQRLKRLYDEDPEEEGAKCSIGEREAYKIRKLIDDGKKNGRVLRSADFDKNEFYEILARADEEGCALCLAPMVYGAYWDNEDGSLICHDCFGREPAMQSSFQFIDFGME